MATIDTTGLELLAKEFVYPEGFDGKAMVGAIWTFYQDKARLGPRAQYLYTKRHIAQLIMQQIWQGVTITEGDESVQHGQRSSQVGRLYSTLNDELMLLEKRVAANRGGAIAAITKTAPIGPGPNQPDPSSRIYRGDPLNRR